MSPFLLPPGPVLAHQRFHLDFTQLSREGEMGVGGVSINFSVQVGFQGKALVPGALEMLFGVRGGRRGVRLGWGGT